MNALFVSSILGILFFCCILLCESLPVQPPEIWKEPCKSQPSSNSNPIVPVIIPPKDVLNILYEEAEVFSAALSKLKKEYVPPGGRRITSPQIIKYLEDIPIDGLSFVEDSLDEAHANVTKTLLNDYQGLSVIAVFMEKMTQDDKEVNDNTKGMIFAYEKLQKFLCELHTYINTVFNVSIPTYVNRDVMGGKLRSISRDRSDRYLRDYSVIHKSNIFVQYLKEKYLDIRNKL